MLAHKLTVTVPASRHVEIDLPSDFPVGEVIVHFEPKAADATPAELPRGHWKRVQAFLAESYKVDRPRMTKEEIDACLAEERESWGDEP
jgi:hypothetical protein